MLKRKIYDNLLNWKKNKKNECLIVNGARQIGKTFIIEQFGKKNYSSFISINFIKNPEYAEIFAGSLEPSEIYLKMSLLVPKIKFVENDTLIFLDEIQVCKNARTALKFLALDNKYDIICSGSLLGLSYNKSVNDTESVNNYVSIPVGYEREIEMFSLDFEEFLWACGMDESAIEGLRLFFDKKEHIDDSINAKFIDYIRKYLFVGGMPEVVNTFLESNNYQSVSQAQNKILKAYEYDIEHYASNKDKPKIRNCYYSIPRQLAKEYTKFQYKCVEKNGSARKYGNSIDWLIDAGLIKCVYNLSLPAVPLRAYEKTEDFKIYVTDIGLLTAMFGFNTQVGLLNNTLTGSAKGGIYENLIFDILMKRGFYLNYYKNHDNSQKIEFVMENSDGIVPIEVKSSRGSTMSLNEFTAKFNPEYAYKLTDGNIGTDGRKITMPHYMAMFI